MAHNGGKWQLNLTYPSSGAEFPFANLIKQVDGTLDWDWSFAKPDHLSPQGYALPGWPVRFSVARIPSQSELTGNYRLRWKGTATLQIGNPHTVVSGSLIGTDGEAVLAIPGNSLGIYYTGDAVDPLHDLSLVHEDYCANYDAGDIWNPRFIERLMESRPGILRFLDWILPNNATARWEHRKPLDYAFWGGYEFRASTYVTTTNVGNDYTTTGSGGVLTHGEVATILLSATPEAPYAMTLNWKGTGPKPLTSMSYLPIGALGYPIHQGGYFFACVYDSVLDAWLMDGGGTVSCGINNAVPVEVCIDLCNRIGAHCWIPIPYLATDPLTDYAASLATLARNTLKPELKLFCEAGNEFWNTVFQYPGTWWGEYRAEKAWGIAPGTGAGTNAFYNKMTANIGHAISDVFGGDRTRFAIVSAGQGVAYYTQSVADSYAENLGRYNARVKGENYHADSGEYAAAVVTHISVTNYWSPAYRETAEEAALNAEYATATAERKAEILNEYVLGPMDQPEGLYRQYSGRPPVNTMSWCALEFQKTHCYDTWAQIAAANGHGFVAYEGGFWADGPIGLDAKNVGTAVRDLVRFDLQNWLDAGGTFPSQYNFASPNWNLGLLGPNIYAPDSPQYLGVIDFNESQTQIPVPTPDHGAFVDLDAYVTLVVDTTAKMTGVVE